MMTMLVGVASCGVGAVRHAHLLRGGMESWEWSCQC